MRKRNRRNHKFSLFQAILVSAVIFTLISMVGKLTIYQGYDLNLRKTPILTVMFEAVKDGIYPWDMIHKANRKNEETTDSDIVMASGLPKQKESKESQIENNPSGIEPNQSSQSSSSPVESSQSDAKQGKDQARHDTESASTDIVNKEENSEETETGKEVSSEGDSETGKEGSSEGDLEAGKESSSEKDSKKEEQENTSKKEKEATKKESGDSKSDEITKEGSKETDLELGEVEQDYFDDALFIGDSRTVGLSEYSYLDNATYYSDVGLSVYSVFDKKIAKLGKKSVTLEEALKKKQFQKIYIMLGINELGTGTMKTFVAKYEEMIDRILKLQPDAYIMIQAIMNIGKEKSDTDKIFNNKNISDRNEGLEILADDKQIFYINVNEILTDKDGYIPENYTFDSIHLKGKYYDKWADFLMENGVVEK